MDSNPADQNTSNNGASGVSPQGNSPVQPTPPPAQSSASGQSNPTPPPIDGAPLPPPQGSGQQGAGQQQGGQYPPAGYPPQDGGFAPQGGMYPPAGYPPQGGQYPPAGYPPQGGQYPPAGYPPQGGQYPPAGYPPQGGQYPPAGYPPQGGMYPPAGYPPQGGQYPPQGGMYPPAGFPPQDAGFPPQGGGFPPMGGAGAAEDTTPANFQLGTKFSKELKVQAPKHSLTFDEKYFITLLAGSISLSKDEKKKIIDSIPKLKQSQIDELIRIFEEEKQKFAALSKKHVPQLEKLAQQHYDEWIDLEGDYDLQNRKKDDTDKAEEIRKQLGM